MKRKRRKKKERKKRKEKKRKHAKQGKIENVCKKENGNRKIKNTYKLKNRNLKEKKRRIEEIRKTAVLGVSGGGVRISRAAVTGCGSTSISETLIEAVSDRPHGRAGIRCSLHREFIASLRRFAFPDLEGPQDIVALLRRPLPATRPRRCAALVSANTSELLHDPGQLWHTYLVFGTGHREPGIRENSQKCF